MVWRLLCLGLGLMELRIILQQVLFTSCAAGTYTCLVLVGLPSGTLASAATGGRRERQFIRHLPQLRLTTSASMPVTSTRRMARIIVGTVSPSAALVLY